MRLAMEVDAKGGFVVQGDREAAQRMGEGAAVLGGLILKALNAPLVTVRPVATAPVATPKKGARRGGRR
jgi:hypothetical protein